MSRSLSLFTLILSLLVLSGCGGGANTDPPGAVSIFGSADVSIVQAEMVLDNTPAKVSVTVGIESNLTNPDPTASTVQLQSYRVTYTRRDGGTTNLQPVEGLLGQTISTGGNSSNTISFEIFALQASEKLYSDFAQEFIVDPTRSPVTFDARVTITGRTTSGDTKTTSFGFVVQAGMFGSGDQFIPNIDYFLQTTGIIYPGNYLATWYVRNTVENAVFFYPWGDTQTVSTDQFPVGLVERSTAVLDLSPGSSFTADSGVLIVNNRFGSDQVDSTDQVVITALPEEVPDPIVIQDVEVLQFYADKTIIAPGEEVTLTYVVTGDDPYLQMLPASFNGVPVVFTGDPSFGSVKIRPTETIRPILKASNSVSQSTAFLRETITVVPPTEPGTTPPVIDFFRTDRSTVRLNKSVVFYWHISGDVDHVELFPFNGNIFDVTGVNSLVSPAFIEVGTVNFSLVVYGQDNSIVRSDISVLVTETLNQPVTITSVVQQPGSSIDNGDEGSFSFIVTDPERVHSSWKASKIAGDSVSYFPPNGDVPSGQGPGVVRFSDAQDNVNGFLTFLVEAWDDRSFGSATSTKAATLVTFTTDGVLSDNAPVIDSFVFEPTGPDTSPGTTGSLSFTFHDPDTLNLDWTLFLVSGDVGGTLSRASGQVDTGSGQVQVSYVDDPDTPTATVVFLLKVNERGSNDPQIAIQTLRLDKGDGAVDDGGGTIPPGSTFGFPTAALYGNFNGDPDSALLLSNGTIYFNGDILTSPRFFRSPDLSNEVPGLSFVVDIEHVSGNPGAINEVVYTRNFKTPSSSSGNTGNLVFVNYFSNPGDRTGGSQTPIQGGVARYRMTFTAEDFKVASYNLPPSGSASYSATISATDTSGEIASLPVTFTVTVPNP